MREGLCECEGGFGGEGGLGESVREGLRVSEGMREGLGVSEGVREGLGVSESV